MKQVIPTNRYVLMFEHHASLVLEEKPNHFPKS